MSRMISLLLATAVAAVLMLAPFILVRRVGPAAHTVLPIMLFGVSGAFVHGLGFVPKTAFLRIAFSPAISWPLMVAGVVFLSLDR